MPLSDFIHSSIALKTQATTRPGFGVGLIVSQHTTFAEVARSYTSLDGMVADGFSSSDVAYKQAAALIAQEPLKVTRWWIGKSSAPVAQVIQFDVDAADDGDYTVTINGVAYTFNASSSTATAIKDGLISAINGGSEPVTAATVDTDSLSLTADVAGVPFTYSVTAPNDNLSTAVTAAHVGYDTDLTTIKSYTKSDFWAVAISSRNSDLIEVAADWVEVNEKFLLAQSSEAAIINPALSTDIISRLKAKSYIRTAVTYHATDGDYVDCAALGRCLPFDAGSITWHDKQLRGVTPGSLGNDAGTSTGAIRAKNGCWFEEVGSRNVFRNGITVGGEYIDIIRGRDWLMSTIELDMIDLSQSVDKIPGDAEGEAMAEGILLASLGKGVARKFINPESIITTPQTRDATDRANRKFAIDWEAQVTGAIHDITLTGTLYA